MYMLVYYICINIYKSILFLSTLLLTKVSVVIVLTGFFFRSTFHSTHLKAII